VLRDAHLQVPVAHGKADLTIYRDAGAAVINVLSKFAVCERASIDEAYLDVTAAAQQLLADVKRGAVTTGSHVSNSSNSGAATAAAAAAAAGESADAGVVQQQDGHTEQLDGPQDLAVPLPDSFEGWHVAGVVSASLCTCSRVQPLAATKAIGLATVPAVSAVITEST
jgi:hypothetical protein